MSTPARICVALAAAAVLSACSPAQRAAPPAPSGVVQPAHPDVHAAIVAANRELADRYNRGDGRGVARLYADDAILLGPRGERIQGREAIDRYWGTPPEGSTWQLQVHSVEGTSEMPVQRGRSILTRQRDGQPVVSDVQFVAIWQRQPDHTYRIAVDAYWRTSPAN